MIWSVRRSLLMHIVLCCNRYGTQLISHRPTRRDETVLSRRRRVGLGCVNNWAEFRWVDDKIVATGLSDSDVTYERGKPSRALQLWMTASVCDGECCASITGVAFMSSWRTWTLAVTSSYSDLTWLTSYPRDVTRFLPGQHDRPVSRLRNCVYGVRAFKRKPAI